MTTTRPRISMSSAASAAPTTVTQPFRVGDRVGDRYEIVQMLADGGMGTVFLAEHTLIKRRVALKVLHAELAADTQMVRRFMNEARAAGTLGHPHIVESFDMGFTAEGVPFIAFEYLEGAVLTEEIYRVGGLTPRRALKIAIQIASALEAAHSAGIVHLDLKCDNVFLTDESGKLDHVKVLDFGISRFMRSDPDKTPRGVLIGTPEYMAPEQVHSPDRVDERADIYALGTLLYEMLAGRRPYVDSDFRILLYRLQHEPPPPIGRDTVSPDLESFVMTKLLAKDPDHRCQTMAEVQEALQQHLDQTRSPSNPMMPIVVPPPVVDASPVAPPVPLELPLVAEAVSLPQPRRRAWPAWCFALAVIAGGAGGVLRYASDRTQTAKNDVARSAVESNAEQLAALLDSQVRSAHLRASGIASTPMLRAAIETDAATIQDMAKGDFVFAPTAGEQLEIVQLVRGVPHSALRVPAAEPSAHPLTGDANRVELDGDKLVVRASAPIQTQRSIVAGAATIAIPIDLSSFKRRIGDSAASATLVGLDHPVELVAGPDRGDIVSVPLVTHDVATGGLALRASIPPIVVGQTFRSAALAAWLVAGAFLLLALVTTFARRRTDPHAL